MTKERKANTFGYRVDGDHVRLLVEVELVIKPWLAKMKKQKELYTEESALLVQNLLQKLRNATLSGNY